jgi:addiction module RelE/StbE family toxin
MTPVRWTAPALADLDLIQDYIAERNPPAASKLINDILDRTDKLLSVNPEIGRAGRVTGTRELILVGTSYVVAYRLKETVEILAVMHGAREWPEKFD